MNALSIRELTKSYPKGPPALRGIDLEVAQGDFFALLGPNGAGKSTAIGIICSLVNKTSGRVEVFGHDMDLDPNGAKACIGLVPQEFNFNQFEPVIEILANQAGYHGIPRASAFAEAEQQLRRIGLWDKRRAMARELSGGMKRRLMIARALVHHPRLLILDEPTAGVDVEIRRSMWDFLTEINRQGVSIILTTHYLEEAESLCRNIAIIHHGRIVEQGGMDALLQRMHKDRLLLNLSRPFSGSLPPLPGCTLIHQSASALEIEIDANTSLNQLFQQLTTLGVEVSGVRHQQNRLERIMLEMADRHDPSAGAA